MHNILFTAQSAKLSSSLQGVKGQDLLLSSNCRPLTKKIKKTHDAYDIYISGFFQQFLPEPLHKPISEDEVGAASLHPPPPCLCPELEAVVGGGEE